jgi:tRNA threonylcarbamoyl adenosine modification protein YeaZ
MILAIDTSTAACSAALFARDGALIDARDEVIGRGHAERLMPMIEELLAGRTPSQILIGCGPGSFTGLRVGLAAAHGMAIGWDIPLAGMSSLALLAAGAPDDGPVAAAMTGGHGELFVQAFERPELAPSGELLNLPPEAAAAAVDTPLVVGTGAALLVAARGSGEAIDLNPSASNALLLPAPLRSLEPRPLYGRAPDARPRQAA